MKKSDVQVGGVYTAKVSERLVPVRIDGVHSRQGWNATNTVTGKRVHIKSAQRLRGAATPTVNPTVEIVTGQPIPDPEHDPDRCATPGCTGEPVVTHCGRPLCQPHWDRVCETETNDAGNGVTAESKPKRPSALDAAAEVLADAGRPLNAKELIDTMAARGLWSSPNGKTPEATLYAALIREIGKKGDAARFQKAARGQFALRPR